MAALYLVTHVYTEIVGRHMIWLSFKQFLWKVAKEVELNDAKEKEDGQEKCDHEESLWENFVSRN